MKPDTDAGDGPLPLGISTCLLGEAVRFDGGHKRDAFLTETLGPFVRWVPVCPELELGLGVPRPALRLERDAAGGELALREVRSGRDHTRAMQRWAAQRVRQLRALELCGYVLKKNSPSCGMERVRVYGGTGPPTRTGSGLYASALLRAFPELPVEEEGRLCDPRLRENFIERIFAYRRLRALFRGRWTLRALIAFHTAHKLQLLAHSPVAYRELGRLVAQAASLPRRELRARYAQSFMRALAQLATRGRNANALQHAAGHLRHRLDADARAELAALIDEYRAGLVPLIVPVVLLRHHVRRLAVATLADQLYLDPHPRELMLRNHV